MDLSAVRSYIEENPTAYAGLRAINVYANDGEDSMAELDEVPFLKSPLFPVLIAMFVILKRLQHLLRRIIGSEYRVNSIDDDAHLFVLNSSNKYRSYSFAEIGYTLLDDGHDVLFICSPDAAEKADDWQRQGFQVETFRQQLRFIPVSHLPKLFFKSIHLSFGLKTRVPEEFATAPQFLVSNMIFLEFLKRDSLQPYTAANTAVHTYSPMPYLLGPADPKRIFVYQHGLQGVANNDTTAITAMRFVPATYLLWGDKWLQRFKQLTHPKADLHVVGSPWHDRLAQMAKDRSVTTEWDVVFLSASNSARSPSRMESYERLVTDVIEICEEHNFTLAIKLHPSEDGEWYRERDLDHYIHEFDDVESAILGTEVMITNASSAFIECSVSGTPIIVTDLWSFGLERLGPLSKVYFTSNRDKMESKIVETVRSQLPDEGETNEIIPIGNSKDRIVDLVTKE